MGTAESCENVEKCISISESLCTHKRNTSFVYWPSVTFAVYAVYNNARLQIKCYMFSFVSFFYRFHRSPNLSHSPAYILEIMPAALLPHCIAPDKHKYNLQLHRNCRRSSSTSSNNNAYLRQIRRWHRLTKYCNNTSSIKRALIVQQLRPQ